MKNRKLKIDVLMSKSSKASEEIKEFFKKGVIVGKESMKNFFEEFELLSQKDKTIYSYSKTYFTKINRPLERKNSAYINWKNETIRMLESLGYAEEIRSVDIENASEQIDSIAFNFFKTIFYDPLEKQFFKQTISAQNIAQREWVKKQYEQSQEELEEQREADRKKYRGQEKKEVKQEASRRDEINIDTRLVIKIEGLLSFTLNYGEDSIVVHLVLNYKDPLIVELDKVIIRNLVSSTKIFVDQLKVLTR